MLNPTITNWDLLRRSWPGVLPADMPLGVNVRKLSVKRHARVTVGASLVIVLSGSLSESVMTPAARIALVSEYTEHCIAVSTIGTVEADVKSDLLIVDGWGVVPEMVAEVNRLRDAEIVRLKRHAASAMVDTVAERVEGYIKAGGCTRCNQRIADRVGASREMVSRCMKALTQEAAS